LGQILKFDHILFLIASLSLVVLVEFICGFVQGGQCSDIVPDFSYHNSFLIADKEEAWVLETADRLWAAEKVEYGCRNISNCLSIGTKVDVCSKGLTELAREKGWWDGVEPFNWATVLGGGAIGELESPDSRWRCGKKLLEEGAVQVKFRVEDMIRILRDEKSGINRPGGDFPTAGSQVSSLGFGTARPCHWFTATPGPSVSVFKPFIFCDNNRITRLVESPKGSALSPGDRKHELWRMVERGFVEVGELESWCLELGEEERRKDNVAIENVFNKAVNREIDLRKQ